MAKATRPHPPAVISIAEGTQGAGDMLEAFIQASPLAIIVIDPNGIVRRWNSAAEQMFGWTAAEAVGRPNPVVPPQAQVEYRRLRKRVLNGEILTGEEVRRQRKDGSLVDVRISSAALRDASGTVTGIVAFLEDVTERKLTDEMRQRAAAIVESSEDAIMGVTLDGIIQAWNPGAERMYGYSAGEMIGQPVSTLVPSGAASTIHQYRDRLHRGESVTHIESVRVRKDGVPIRVSLTLSPIRDHDGRVTGVATISRDITERRRAEDEIRRRAAHLEVLNQVIAAASSATDVTQLLGVAIDQTLRTLKCEMGGIWAEDTHIMHGLAPDAGAAIQRACADAGVRRSGPAGIDDWTRADDPASKPLASLMTKFGIRASLTVPIRTDGRCIGGLALASSEPRAWQPEEIALAETVGRQVGAAAQRLRMFQDTQQHARLMSRLVSLTETLNAPLTVPEAVIAIGQGAMQLCAADRGAVYVRQPEGTIICPWSLGLSSDHIGEVLGRQSSLTIGRLMAGAAQERLVLPDGRTLDARRPFIYSDMQALPDGELVRRVAEREGYRAVGNLPLIFEGRVIAVVSCYYDTPRTWTEPEHDVYQSFCWQSAVALQNAGLREGQAQRTMELEVLAEVSKRLRAARTAEEMYPILVDQPLALFGAGYGSLALLDESGHQFTRVHTVGLPAELPGSTFSLTGSLAGRVAETGVAHVASDIAAASLPKWRDSLKDRRIGPVVIVPVRSEQEIIGTLALARMRTPDVLPFAEAEVRLLQAIAEIGGTAIRRARLYQNLEQSYIQMVLALARTVDARDTYTSGHSERIAVWAEAVARALGCGAEEIQNIRWAALLHDIGKVGVPDEILRKPGSLSAAEWDVMRQHPVIGAGILVSTDRMHGVAKIVRHHQERWDGTGYPDGLRSEEIPLGARILAVVDAYSAITDNRPYKAARTHAEAVAELRRCAATQFDSRVVEIFCRIVEAPA
ncbi:MAG TPA: PAS domain S-box protein [bacterium]|nr:PAS domain S-box protein [bacterium]